MFLTKSRSLLGCASLIVLLTALGSGVAEDKPAKNSREELEKTFSEQMTGSVLVGHYSVVGKETKPANPERYELKKFAKVKDDLWLFEARTKTRQTDVTLPPILTV